MNLLYVIMDTLRVSVSTWMQFNQSEENNN